MMSVANRESDRWVGWAPVKAPTWLLADPLGPTAVRALYCTHVGAKPDVHLSSTTAGVDADTSDVFVSRWGCRSGTCKQSFHLLRANSY